MGFVTPSQNRPKFDFSVSVTIPKGILFPSQNRPNFDFSVGVTIPKEILFPSQNRPKFDFSVGVTIPKEIPCTQKVPSFVCFLYMCDGVVCEINTQQIVFKSVIVNEIQEAIFNRNI